MTAADRFRAAQARLLEHHGVAAESSFFDVAAVSGPAHALVAGEGDPVVMVPGFADPAVLWAPLMAELGGFRVVAVDRPCFGLSGRVEHRTETFRDLAVTFLGQVLEALDLDRPVLVGNSIGSTWAFWFAIAHPERVAGMVHLGCPAFALGTSAPFPMRLLSLPGLGRVLMALTPPSEKQMLRFGEMAGVDLSGHPELVELLVAAQELPGYRRSIRELLRAVVRLRGARPRVRLTSADLARVRAPTKLVWGSEDPFGGLEVGRAVEACLPDAGLQAVEDAGHLPWVNHAAEVGRVVRAFLDEG